MKKIYPFKISPVKYVLKSCNNNKIIVAAQSRCMQPLSCEVLSLLSSLAEDV